MEAGDAMFELSLFEKQVGKYLLEHSLVERSDIQRAINVAMEEGISFCDALIRLGLIEPSMLERLRKGRTEDESPADAGAEQGEEAGSPAGGARQGDAAPAGGGAEAHGEAPLPVQDGIVRATRTRRIRIPGRIEKKPLGRYLVEDGIIDERQAQQALDYARSNDVPFGTALVSLKFIDEETLARYVLKQRADMQKLMARAKKVRLGDILLENKLISQSKLDEALQYSKAKGVRLGEALVQLGYMKEKEIAEVLAAQLMVPFVDLKRNPPDPTIARKIPRALCMKHKAIPYRLEGNLLTVAMVDPLNIIALDDFQGISGYNTIPVLVTESDFEEATRALFGGDDDEELLEVIEQDYAQRYQQQIEAMDQQGEDAPIVKLVHKFIAMAVQKEASDVHIEPAENICTVRMRIDGMLRVVTTAPISFHAAIVSRLKIMASLNIAETRLPQDGKFRLKVGRKVVDFRVSFVPLVTGEKVVIRLLDQSKARITLEELGMERKAYKDFYEGLHSPYGIVLVTGPTGSGKTTTLYAGLLEIINPRINIHTVEDPVEYNLPGVTQVQVQPDIGRTFSSVLKAFLRQDPDVILVGEIRDGETASIALKSAMTGHLVLSTLHTNDAVSTIDRLITMGVDRFLIATAVRTVVAQRLVRKLCVTCKEEFQPDEELLRKLGVCDYLKEQAGLEPDEPLRVFRPVGCSLCEEGYKGRIGIYEILSFDERLREMIVEGASNWELLEYAKDCGMLTLRESAVAKFLKGITSTDEIFRLTLPSVSKQRRSSYVLGEEEEQQNEQEELARTLAALDSTLGRLSSFCEKAVSPVETRGMQRIVAAMASACRRGLKERTTAQEALERMTVYIENLGDYYSDPPSEEAELTVKALEDEIVRKFPAWKRRISAYASTDLEDARLVVDAGEPVPEQAFRLRWAAMSRCVKQGMFNALLALAGKERKLVKVTLRLHPEDGVVEVSILDSGCGFDESRLETLKRPFEASFEGTGGLGLAIVEKTVASTGGASWELKSKVGKGSLLRVRFPVNTV